MNNIFRILIFFILILTFPFELFPNENDNLRDKVDNCISIISKINFPIETQENKDINKIILLKWDDKSSSYKVVLYYPITKSEFRDRKIYSNGNVVSIKGKFNTSSNMLNVYIHFYEKKDGILLDYYELNTIVKLKKNDINLLGWSSSISRFNTNPKFISFVKFD